MHTTGLIESWIKKKIKKDTLLWITLKYFGFPVILLINFRYYRQEYKKQAYPGSYRNNFTRWLYLLFKGKVDLIYKAYFDTAFNFGKIDIKIIKRLQETMPLDDEGCLFDGINSLRTRTQIIFLASIIKQINAKGVLETGTHKAMFCYIAYLCDSSISIDTFGNLPASQENVGILNQKYGKYIEYHLGDSKITLKDFSPGYQIDFAWVDGGHSFETCLSDLVNCSRLGIPSIAVDDYKWDNNVKRAVEEFVEKYNYSISGISNLADHRGIVYLTKNKKDYKTPDSLLPNRESVPAH
jgi:hypothetical protein